MADQINRLGPLSANEIDDGCHILQVLSADSEGVGACDAIRPVRRNIHESGYKALLTKQAGEKTFTLAF